MISTRWFSGEDNLDDAHAIRRTVFIEEQGVSEADEMDGTDGGAIHLVAYDNGLPVATGRILLPVGFGGSESIADINEEFILGRIAVLKECRGKGYGDLVVRMLIRKAYNMGGETQYIHSQISARGFYEKLGFEAYGQEYEEAGIPHINMRHVGDVTGNC